MAKSICIFEDSKVEQLYPLALSRPVYDLRCGFSTLKEKISHQFPLAALALHCRKYLVDLVKQENPDTPVNEFNHEECLFINGRVLVDSNFLKDLDDTRECLYVRDDEVIAAFLRKESIASLSVQDYLSFESLSLQTVEVMAKMIAYPWDLVNYNPEEIAYDFAKLSRGGEIHGHVHERATLLETKNIYVGHDTVIKPGAVLDAVEGPIYLGNNVKVLANAVIEGPAFVGDNSIIKIAAKIYEGTSIGEVCKVGGEVEESIIHSHSNKQHDGFLGHAYLGQWVNLGADTNNSDLKNNYGNVKVTINGRKVDSGSMFVGLTMGDHSKCGINTMFNTGSVVGVMCNIWGGTFPPAYLPSYSWGGSEGLSEYQLFKAIDTAKKVMARRNVAMSENYEAVFRHIFEVTQQERAAAQF